MVCPTLGLAGEAGEVADKIKKIIRDKGGEFTQHDRLEIQGTGRRIVVHLTDLADLDIGLESIAIVYA